MNLQHSIKKTYVTVDEDFDQIMFCREPPYKESAWAKSWLEFGVLSSLSFRINFQGILKSWELVLDKQFVKEMENVLARGKGEKVDLGE